MSALSLTLAQTNTFGDLDVQLYKDSAGCMYMTRDQIGRALEYTTPAKAISNIHTRNEDRLNPLSGTLKLRSPDGGGLQNTTVYTLRGVMEICRLSRQKKADAFIDFVWDIMESLYYGKALLTTPDMSAAITPNALQAKFDALLSSHNNMEARLAACERAVSQMNQLPVAADQSPRKGSYTPRSAWNTEAYSLLKPLARSKGVTVDTVLNDIYRYMTANYTLMFSEERKRYISRHGHKHNISALDMIEDNSMYAGIFMSVLKDRYNDAFPAQTQVVEPLQNDAERFDRDAVELVELHHPAERAAYMSQLAAKIAQKTNDRTPYNGRSFRLVYGQMGHDYDRVRNDIYSRMGHGRTMVQAIASSDAGFSAFQIAAAKVLKSLS